MTKKNVTVRVPASSGNLGVGFDVLGLALNFYSELTVHVVSEKPGDPIIIVDGEGEESVPLDRSNIIFKCIAAVYKRAGKRVPTLELHCRNRIPLARGLGSSSAAIVAGLVAGNKLLGNRFDSETILNMATQMEGHADNVASALYGGVRTNLIVDKNVVSLAWPVPKCKFVAAVPAFKLSTKTARAVLPKKISMSDVVANLASISVLSEAFRGKLNLLGDALNDRLHEPYRAKLIPGFYAVKKAALKAGAYGVILSGAGPTMLSFVAPGKAARVGKAMASAFKKAGVKNKILVLDIDRKGAVVR